MYHYSILEPLKFNWKYTAPKSFTELEYFLTPELSIGIERISNGKNDFAVGAFLVGSMDKGKFNSEFLVKRSAERTLAAFDKEHISVFFTPKEAEDMTALFEEERFIARQITIYRKGMKAELFDLNEDDFTKVMEAFGELGVQQSIDFKSEKESYEELRTDMYEEAYQKARKDFRMTGKSREQVTKSELYKQVGFGSGFVIASGVLNAVAKRLYSKGLFGLFGGGVCKLLSVASGMVGLKYVNGAVDYYSEGVVFE